MTPKKIFLHIKSLLLDKNEKDFIKLAKEKVSKNQIIKKNLLIEIQADYYHLCYYKSIYQDRFKEYNIYGYWPDFLHVNTKTNNFIYKFYKKYKAEIYFYFVRKKWEKLYQAIGVKEVFSFQDLQKKYVDSLDNKKAIENSKKIFKKLKNKRDVLNICIKSINCGDLIYDSYIRYRNEPTVDINDYFLEDLILKSILLTDAAKKFVNEKNFNNYYTGYTSYINHGLLCRFFLKFGVNVYSDANYQYNKKLSIKDNTTAENFRLFKNKFKKLKNKHMKLNLSKKMIQSYFSARPTKSKLYYYMHKNPYKTMGYDLSILKRNNIKGVVFLPNFFESQRYWGDSVFVDLYEWMISTLEIIRKNKLNIALKPHPNIYSDNYSGLMQAHESIKVFEELKRKYSDLIWLDHHVSNKEIFNNIKFGVSPWGSVLWEIAYHGKVAISAGMHPAKYYNISYDPINENDYQKLLINAHLLKKKKYLLNDIYEFCYMLMIREEDNYKTIARKIQLKKNVPLVRVKDSQNLIKFLKLYKDYIKTNLKSL